MYCKYELKNSLSASLFWILKNKEANQFCIQPTNPQPKCIVSEHTWKINNILNQNCNFILEAMKILVYISRLGRQVKKRRKMQAAGKTRI